MAKQTGCVLNTNHAGECYVGTKTYDCGDAQQSAEIAQLRAENARLREAMPSAEEREHVRMMRDEDKLNAECPDHIASIGIVDRWLARLDAARAEVGV